MIIFINGSINSGKSTISKLLQKIIPNTALVEVDSLREFIDWMPLQKSISLNLQNAVSVIKNFVDQKLNVIIPYHYQKKIIYSLLMSCLQLIQKLYILH